MGSRTRGRSATHIQRRRSLIEVATAIVAERGVGAVTHTAVAARADVSPGRVQHYFPTKSDLLGGVFDEVHTAYSWRLHALACDDPTLPSARSAIANILCGLVPDDRVGTAHAQFRRAFTTLSINQEGLADRIREVSHQLLHAVLARLIAGERENGWVRSDVDPGAAAVGLAARAEGVALYVLIGVTDPDHARALVLEALQQLYSPRDGVGRSHWWPPESTSSTPSTAPD